MARKASKNPPKTKKYFRSTKSGAGMTKAGVARYRRENPGSKLKTAVTGKVKPGSKDAKRRKSFCARSKSWTGPRGKAARRRWKCQMTSKELLKMLEKHESVCNARFDGINNKLNKLDTRLWGIYGVIIGVAVLEKFL